ncbi:hypothetical protein A4D02_18960 [Niastella koreensis]|uniref:Uncharacterized protein n=2 Tax=Niastella koreensis TaxID=354356 RepID=G8T7W4_NIAKG|nr:hypothetical protein Niako_0507 [Niastella koreensis GR20-10]OQP39392.1 hypothetical protein A4D02_18960 [Niastella koreensis]
MDKEQNIIYSGHVYNDTTLTGDFQGTETMPCLHKALFVGSNLFTTALTSKSDMKGFLIAISLISLVLSCGHSASGTLDYNTLNYDTSRTVILTWDTTKYRFPKGSEPLPLTQSDLTLIDSLLNDAIDSFNIQFTHGMYEAFDRKVPIDSFIIVQQKYKNQYYPFKDVNGQRVVTIIGFSTEFPLWKKEMYQPRLHYGMRMFELRVNLTEKNRDNLHSGDFG